MKLNYSKAIMKTEKKPRPLFDTTPIPVDSAWNDFFLRLAVSNSSVSELYEF